MAAVCQNGAAGLVGEHVVRDDVLSSIQQHLLAMMRALLVTHLLMFSRWSCIE